MPKFARPHCAGAFPVLFITGQKPILKSKQGQFQIVDIVTLFKPITKVARQLVHGGQVPAYVREAIRCSEEERPGPSHLELPEDVARQTVRTYTLYPSFFHLELPKNVGAQYQLLKPGLLTPSQLLISLC